MARPSRIEIPNLKTPAIFDDVLNDQDFFKDIDKAFTRIQMSKTPAKAGKLKAKAKTKGLMKDESKEMQKTFKSMIQLHLSPVIRYLKAVDLGVTSKDITEIMEYIVAPLIMKSKNVGLKTETKTLIDFQRVLKKVNRSEGKITPEETAALTASFNSVTKEYGLNFRGHSTAVVNVIGFFKVIKRKEKFSTADLRKLFSIGIPSLSMLRKISLEEMSSLTGLAMERCSELRAESRKFTLYIFV
ncbi:MAG: hypothetical protein IT286_04170 [Proteobacteria bacterium]|jgi:hypothetical protein|nr:hypothetical protein [Pseudomonadota bacterium]